MRIYSTIFIVILLQTLVGCATKSLESIGLRFDKFHDYSSINSDGQRAIIHYSVEEYSNGRNSSYLGMKERWAEVEPTKLKWVPLSQLSDFSASYSFKTNRELPDPVNQNPLPSIIPLHKIEILKSNTSSFGNRITPSTEIFIGDQHKADVNKSPISGFYGTPKTNSLILIRDDINHIGEVESAIIEPNNQYRDDYVESWAPTTRKVLYPFALVIDVITFPIQLVYWVIALGQIHG